MHLHTVLLPCVCVSGFDKFIWRTIGPKSIVHFSHDYIVTNSINVLLIGSKSIPNGTHTNPWLSQFASCFKTYQKLWYVCMCVHMCVCSTVHNVLCASVCTLCMYVCRYCAYLQFKNGSKATIGDRNSYIDTQQPNTNTGITIYTI